MPKNYYFFPESSEYFEFTHIDKNIKIAYAIDDYVGDDDITNDDVISDEEIYENIKQWISYHQREAYEIEAPIEKFEHNGFRGYCSTYGDDEETVFEAGLLLDNGIALTITIYDGTHTIEEIKNTPEFKAVFEGIKRI